MIDRQNHQEKLRVHIKLNYLINHKDNKFIEKKYRSKIFILFFLYSIFILLHFNDLKMMKFK